MAVADNNDTDGISIEQGLVQECISSNNGGDGINVGSDGATVIDNVLHENDVNGIHCDANAAKTQNALAARVACLCAWAHSRGVLFIVEQPTTSLLFNYAPWQDPT